MSNLITLHQRQVFLETGTAAAYAKLYVYLTGTSTQVDIFADSALTSALSQPVEADAEGVFPAIYVGSAELLRLLATDEDDVALPGYPMDGIIPVATSGTGAAGVSFSPTEDVTATTVQAAIEQVADLFTDQTAINNRALTPWVTGGSGDAYTITPTPAITAYGGNTFLIRPNRANTTTSPTLNINGLGTRPLMNAGASLTPTALDVGELQPGREVLVYEDGETAYVTLGRNFPTSDTNGDGRWTKYPGGMLICTKTLTGQGPISTADGSTFRSAAIDLGSWAATFTETPLCFVGTSHATDQSWVAQRRAPTTTNAGVVLLYRAATSANTDFQIQVVGVGRWF